MKRVTLTWNEAKNCWDLFHYKGKKQKPYFIMDFHPCENVDLYFQFPEKDRPNHYEIEIKKVDK